MTSWQEAQDTLSAALGDDTGAAARMPALVGSDVGRAMRGLGVYRANTLGARARACEQVYPVCRAIVGERCFRTLVRDALQRPSGAADLNLAEDAFPHVLRTACEWTTFAGMAYLPDLARLEQLLHHAYFAADTPAAVPADITERLQAAPEDVRFVLSPSVQLYRSRYGIGTLWREHAAGKTPTQVADRPERLVVHRQQWRPDVSVVDGACWQVLDAIRSGVTFRELADLPRTVPTLLTGMSAGWIIAVDGQRS